MSKSVANVVIATDTFVGLVGKTNTILDLLTNQILTTEFNAYGGNTSGNASVLGILSANVIATPVIRGGSAGNTATISAITLGHANSTVSSNVTIAGYLATVSANALNVTSNTTLTASALSVNVSTISLVGNVTIGSNTSQNLTVYGNTISVNTTNLNVSANVVVEGNTLTVNSHVVLDGANLNIDSTHLHITSNTNFDNTSTFSAITTFNANTTFNAPVNVTNTAYIDTSIVFTGNTSAFVQSTTTYNFANTVETTIIDSFPISQYKAAKYTISAKNTANTNVMQLSELTLVHGNNGANSVHSTEYGTIYSSTKFATYTADANSTHVFISANSSVSNVSFALVKTAFA